MKFNIKAFKQRVKALWKICSTRNFILLYGIEEIKIDGEDGRKFAWLRRTDYNAESDFYTQKAAMCSQFGLQILDENGKIGNFIPAGHEWDYTITEEALKEAGWKYVEKSPFTGNPEWVHSEYIDTHLNMTCYNFYLTIPEDIFDVPTICYNAHTIYKRSVTDMKEINEFVKFFS
jgi:hypothetical protein